MKRVRKFVFRLLAALNRHILPRYSRRDLARLGKFDKLIIAFRYFIVRNSLD
jgi:hypothetical protein